MSKNVIHIYGASGSGTTTLAKHIHNNMDYFFMDTDDYFWLPTNPPYTEKRKIQERVQLMREDIEKYDKIVISGSLVNWGNELIPFFSLAVRLVTDTDIRIARLKEREKGSLILELKRVEICIKIIWNLLSGRLSMIMGI